MPDLLSSDPSTSSTALDSAETENRHFLPEIGAWVVLTIDPIASLSEVAREVPEAVEACKRLVNKQYVALVARDEALYLPWAPYNSYLIRLLQQGHPPAVPEKFLDASMSVPVLPTTQETHISGRAPLISSAMLPWSDCFIAFSGDHTVRSPSMWASESPRWTIDQKENSRLRNFMVDDILAARAKKYPPQSDQEDDYDEADSIGRPESSRRAGSMVEASRVVSASPTNSEATEKSGPYFSACSGSGRFDDESVFEGEQPETGARKVVGGDSEEHQDDDRNAEAHEDNESLNDVKNLLFSQGVHSKAMTTVRFTHDLSTVTKLNDIADYFKEVQAIERIEKEAASRVEECRALRLQNEIIRAQEMDAAVHGERHSTHMLTERISPRDEASIAGRSAIEPNSVVNSPGAGEEKADRPLDPTGHDPSPAKTKGRGLIVRITSKVKKSGRLALRVLAVPPSGHIKWKLIDKIAFTGQNIQ